MGITVFPTPTSSSGGGYNQKLPSVQFGSSDTQIWTPLYSGCVAFHVIGGGGKGATSGCGGGGGSGSYARKVLDITTDQCFCIKVGGQGGCSFVCSVTASPTLNVIAYGGSNGSGNTGGTGGCCPSSGADVRRCGLCGGSGGGSSNQHGGGSAVDIWGLQRGCGGSAGGSENNSAGGGGIGGQGGDSSTSDAQYPTAGGGGGSGGSGTAARCWISCWLGAYGGERALAVPPGEEKFWSFVPEWGIGGYYQWACTDGSSSWRFTNTIPPGIGGGGAGSGGQANKGGAQSGGMFGGGGGGQIGGRGGCGGGGGGHTNCCSTGLTTGGGGHGVVFVEYLSVST